MNFREVTANMEEALRICQKYGCELHQWHDYARQESNEAAGHQLCDHCGGTGNELFSMYRKCPKCDGTGVEALEEKEAQPATTVSGQKEQI